MTNLQQIPIAGAFTTEVRPQPAATPPPPVGTPGVFSVRSFGSVISIGSIAMVSLGSTPMRISQISAAGTATVVRQVDEIPLSATSTRQLNDGLADARAGRITPVNVRDVLRRIKR